MSVGPGMDTHPADLDALAGFFRYFGEVETPRLDSAVYTAYALGVAEDPDLLELASETMPGQPAPNVLFAAVQHLLLLDENTRAGAARDPLAAWYPALSGASIPASSPWPEFRRFCLENAERLRPIVRSGRTQTCVVQRCVALLPALASLPRLAQAEGRAALLEIGPSAGLNLRLDGYRYDYGNGRVWGDPSALLLLTTEDRGERPPPLPPRLEVRARRGLELNPVDPSDPETARWLRALVWPEHFERARAMDAALAHAARVPAEIEAGDAVRDLEAAIARLPRDAARVVFATHVLYQIPVEGREAIEAALAKASVEAPLDWIAMDSSGQGDSKIEHACFEGGRSRSRATLARADSHGRWIAWGRS